MDQLRGLLKGSTRVFVRYTIEDAPSGDAYSYGCALRTQALPMRTDDEELLWEPALRFRFKAR